MKSQHITPDVSSYEHIVAHHANFQNVAMCLQTLDEIYSKGVLPTLRTANMIINCACRASMPQLALDIARAFEANAPHQLDAYSWLSVLECAAEHLLVRNISAFLYDAMQVHTKLHRPIGRGSAAWMAPRSDSWRDHPCRRLNYPVALYTAARHGLPDVAHQAIRSLRLIGQVPSEQHVAALLEALIQDDKIREAFAGVEHLRSELPDGITDETTRPLRAWVGQHPSHIDKAWALMEDIRRNQTPEPGNVSAVDIAILNAVIGGATDLDDMQRAVGIYKESATFGVGPDADTLNILLAGCIKTSSHDLADSLISEMKNLGNADTYESMIQLRLTQPSYGNAFHILEDMKSAGFKPTSRIYEVIVQRCYEAFDPRWKVALTEMKESGYEPNHRIKSLIKDRTEIEIRKQSELR